MKINFKTLTIILLILAAMCLFIFYPFQCTDLHLKITFSDDSAYTDCTAYYTTAQNPAYGNEQMIPATVTDGIADIIFPKELCGTLTGLRLDFSQTDSLIRIARVELCSAGFVQTSLDASEFFAESQILATNDISAVQPVMATAYIKADGYDPYIYFQPAIVQACNEAYSHYTGSKLAICLFLIITVFLARKQLFTAE